MREFHPTSVKAYDTCARKFRWGEEWEDPAPADYLSRGRIIHEALQLYYHPRTTMTLQVAIEIAVKAELARGYAFSEDVSELVWGILTHYNLYYSNPMRQNTRPFSDERLDFVALEKQFKMRFEPWQANLVMVGRFDGVVWDKQENGLWVFETKTVRSIDEFIQTIPHDVQPLAYTLAAKEVYSDLPVLGVLYNLIRSKAPANPRILKNGTISMAKNQDTSLEWYVYCLETFHGMTRDEIKADQDIMQFLRVVESKNDKWFYRYAYRPDHDQLAFAYDDFYQVGLDMTRESNPFRPQRNYWGCRQCPFAEMCENYRRGYVVDPVDYGFRPRTDRQRVTKIGYDTIVIGEDVYNMDGDLIA